MTKIQKEKPSYNSLKESLRCANEEAPGYLDTVSVLRAQVAKLETELDCMDGLKFTLRIIGQALSDAQKAARSRS